jgi:hypothetical protein
MSQNLSIQQFRWIVKRLVATGDSKHGNASLSMNCFWAGLGEHMPNAEWAVGFTAFLEMSQYFWAAARFRSPTNWPAALSAMRVTMVGVIKTCKSNTKPVGISRAVFEAHAKANLAQIAPSQAPTGPSFHSANAPNPVLVCVCGPSVPPPLSTQSDGPRTRRDGRLPPGHAVGGGRMPTCRLGHA